MKLIQPPGEMRIVGISGPSGSGKTTLARNLLRHLRGWAPLSLATPVKRMAILDHGYSAREVYSPRDKSPSLRRLLQNLGVESGRYVWGEEVWLNHLVTELFRLRTYAVPGVIIDDVRFLNEREFVKHNGGFLLQLTAPGTLTVGTGAEHRSETEVHVPGPKPSLKLDRSPGGQYDDADIAARAIRRHFFPEAYAG